VYVVGGANSAGQAAMNFARYADRVVILVRGESLSSTMSQYLIDQIRETPNIQLWTHASVVEAHGETHLHWPKLQPENVVSKPWNVSCPSDCTGQLKLHEAHYDETRFWWQSQLACSTTPSCRVTPGRHRGNLHEPPTFCCDGPVFLRSDDQDANRRIASRNVRVSQAARVGDGVDCET